MALTTDTEEAEMTWMQLLVLRSSLSGERKGSMPVKKIKSKVHFKCYNDSNSTRVQTLNAKLIRVLHSGNFQGTLNTQFRHFFSIPKGAFKVKASVRSITTYLRLVKIVVVTVMY